MSDWETGKLLLFDGFNSLSYITEYLDDSASTHSSTQLLCSQDWRKYCFILPYASKNIRYYIITRWIII